MSFRLDLFATAEPLQASEFMRSAIEQAERARATSSPNPWVGAVVVGLGGEIAVGHTQAPGGPHAEVVALAGAGERARGATLYVTLEPCRHHGKTPPCTDAIVQAGIAKVVVGVEDPDPQVAGAGIATLRRSGIEVVVGDGAGAVSAQLAPYLKHRRTGRPWVVLKLATTLDGRIAAPDGSSRWITGAEAREDAHLLRAHSDAILVGAGTVRADNPQLTVRLEAEQRSGVRQPLRVVLGKIPEGSRVLPAEEMSSDLETVLEALGQRGVVQLLVEGGAGVAHSFHSAGLVDRYVFYVSPTLMGGDDGTGIFRGAGSKSMKDLWRGRFVSITRLGEDIRVDVESAPAS